MKARKLTLAVAFVLSTALGGSSLADELQRGQSIERRIAVQRATQAAIWGMPAVGIDEDGSVDRYFTAEASKGLESNWIPTGGEDFFLLFRLYGPDEPLFKKTWVLGDVEKLP